MKVIVDIFSKHLAMKRLFGVKIYKYPRNLEDVLNMWEICGFNAVYVSYQMDNIAEFISELKRLGITIFLIFPVFQDPDELKKEPSLYSRMKDGREAKEDWVEFACPSNEVFLQRKGLLLERLVETLDIDVISFDFIRYFVFWEVIHPNTSPEDLPETCYCERCRRRFNSAFPNSQLDTPDWVQFKCDTITSGVQYLTKIAKRVKPSIRVSLHTLPWKQSDFNGGIKRIAGQDFTALGKYADFLSPMIYHHMIYKKPEWIPSLLNDIKSVYHGAILPSLQVNHSYRNEELSPNEFEQAIDECLRVPIAGIIFWNNDALLANKEKQEIVRRKIHEI